MPPKAPPSLSHRIFVLDAPVPLLDESRAREMTVAYSDHLLEMLRMERLGPLEFYPAIDLTAPGWSWIQPISTSHTSGHYWSAPGHPNLHVDIYSCMPFSWEGVIQVAHEHFHLLDWTATLVMRETDLSKRTTFHIIGRGKDILRRCELRSASVARPGRAVHSPVLVGATMRA